MSKQTTAELPVWIAEKTIAEIARGQSHIPVHVHGYWSDVISVYCRPEWSSFTAKEFTWKLEVTHSAGGRDRDEIEDDVRASELFAQGLFAACQYARLLRSKSAELNAAYLIYRAEVKAEADAEEVAKKHAVDSDFALGEKAAISMLDGLLHAAGIHHIAHIIAYERGDEERHFKIFAREGRDGVIRFFDTSVPISRVNLIKKLATLSVRSFIDSN